MTLSLQADPQHGARIFSLADESGFEWLWSKPDPQRFSVRPGDPFVDIGGGEECFPTISGQPDHGDVWARPWSDEDGTLCVETSEGVLTRGTTNLSDGVQLNYRLEGAAGLPFVWALHAVLPPAVGTILRVPGCPPVHYWSEGNNNPPIHASWPTPTEDCDLRILPGNDGTARFAAVETSVVTVIAPSGNWLHVELFSDDQPRSIGIWRNFGGYPENGPRYRSFCIEPLLGLHHERARAQPDELAHIPVSGVLEWSVRFTAGTSTDTLVENP